MATTFYGAWYVVLNLVISISASSIRISSSEMPTESYPVHNGNALVLKVQGGEWQIHLEISFCHSVIQVRH